MNIIKQQDAFTGQFITANALRVNTGNNSRKIVRYRRSKYRVAAISIRKIQSGECLLFIHCFRVNMHLLGKSFWAYAVKPTGDTVRLIRINKWDFRWQYFYNFEKMVHLPKGTTIYTEGVYDNTASNPHNPFDPPQEVSERNGSMRTTDEMFQLIVTYVPYREGDENISLTK